MKKILAISLALVMLVGLMSALGVSAESTTLDLSLAMASVDKKDPYFNTKVSNSGFTVTDGVAKLEGNLVPGSGRASLNYENVFTAEGVDDHLTQTLCITSLSVTSLKNPTAKVARGYYNLLTRNYRGVTVTNENDGSEYLLYSITCIDAEGNLQLNVFNSVAANAVPVHSVSLGKKLGDTFVLTTVWHANNNATFYVGGSSVGTFENVTAKYAVDGDGYTESLNLGVNYKGVATTVDTDGDGTPDAAPVNLTISNVSISHGDSNETTPPTTTAPAETTAPATTAPAETTAPATTAPAETTAPATTAPAETTAPATTAPAGTTAPAATTAPATTTPTNPETGSTSNAMYITMLAVSTLAMVVLMVPDIRNKLIRK